MHITAVTLHNSSFGAPSVFVFRLYTYRVEGLIDLLVCVCVFCIGSRSQAAEARRRPHILQPDLLGRAAQDQIR